MLRQSNFIVVDALFQTCRENFRRDLDDILASATTCFLVGPAEINSLADHLITKQQAKLTKLGPNAIREKSWTTSVLVSAVLHMAQKFLKQTVLPVVTIALGTPGDPYQTVQVRPPQVYLQDLLHSVFDKANLLPAFLQEVANKLESTINFSPAATLKGLLFLR